MSPKTTVAIIIKRKRSLASSEYLYRNSTMTQASQRESIELTHYMGMEAKTKSEAVPYGTASESGIDAWEIVPEDLEFGELIGKGGERIS